MDKAIAIGGVPATGKTTLLRRIRQYFADYSAPHKFKYGLVRGEYYQHEGKRIFFIGVFDGSTFEGTDKLSMAVQTQFNLFIATFLKKKENKNAVVVFEGDRLFNSVTIKTTQPIVYLLETNGEAIAKRHVERSDSQGETFLKGRATKISNIKNSCEHIVLQSDTVDDIDTNASLIIRRILN